MAGIVIDKARWYEDGDGFWVAFRTQDRRAAVSLVSSIDKPYTVTVKPHREKRSLDANSYYWVLLRQLAEALNLSIGAAHNLMLRRYGQLETMDEKVVYLVVPDTDEAFQKALEAETYHIKPTSQTKDGKDGLTYRVYLMLRGSHSYDAKEMSVLIDGLISECRDVGIETMTPAELSRLEGYGG